ncbi:DUF4331 domain-containing protein [Streptacidiphilus sp. ASG 303]|uniref:DUF4331 domain-containing protein n=1 Tax=Streptacidiphilus sp. ASG 303 TaxID=2896847 RepID=UPI001E446E1A|nr:DUF4331 domain-containing protein [Streptacidiphilus sp. ASG 303]MCD0482027.1 DUF4331 domain-containing protein [Streptacidiphilus sp. ASG 303]
MSSAMPSGPVDDGAHPGGADPGPPVRRRRRTALAAASLLASGPLAAAALVVLQATPAAASSHREAPLISGQPQYDNTDLYAFVSPDKPDTTTLIANWTPFEDPTGGPNFYPFPTDARYEVNIDNDGDALPDLVYRWSFRTSTRNGSTFLYNTGPVTSLDDPDLNVRQTYDLELVHLSHGHRTSVQKLAANAPVAPSDVGRASMPDYASLRHHAVSRLYDGSTGFAGQADDPFFLDLRVFDLLYGGDLSEVGDDTLRGYNVNTVALQVPTHMLTADAQHPVIGIWSTTSRQSALSKDWEQVSRLGNPLVNEVVIPVAEKDRFNASKPRDDAQFLRRVTNPELPKLLEAVHRIPAPAEPRDDLVQVFLTGVPKLNEVVGGRPSEVLRLNTAVRPAAEPKRLGVLDGDTAGFPNGRRLTDDVVDIALQAVTGELRGARSDLGDAVDANDVDFEKAFPYVALPHAGSDAPGARGASAGGAPQAGAYGQAAAPESGLAALAGGSGGNGMAVGIGLGGAVGAVLLAGLLVGRRRRRRSGAHAR